MLVLLIYQRKPVIVTPTIQLFFRQVFSGNKMMCSTMRRPIDGYGLMTSLKDEILSSYPDCTLTASMDGGYVLKNVAFTFKVYKSGENHFTEVKKNS